MTTQQTRGDYLLIYGPFNDLGFLWTAKAGSVGLAGHYAVVSSVIPHFEAEGVAGLVSIFF
jgi:hypothetical protein